MDEPWFRKRRPELGEGYGWHPSTRQGWWALASFSALVVILGLIVPRLAPPPVGIIAFVVLTGICALAFIMFMRSRSGD